MWIKFTKLGVLGRNKIGFVDRISAKVSVSVELRNLWNNNNKNKVTSVMYANHMWDEFEAVLFSLRVAKLYQFFMGINESYLRI